MELYQIRYFLALSETLNFTRAAERCFVSQPALTKAIQKLEELLGGRLFDRTKSTVQLTELGQAMLPSFQQIYTTANQAREKAHRLVRERRVEIRVGVMCTIALDVLLPGILAYQAEHPEVDLQFHDGTMKMLTDSLDKNELDVAVMAAPYECPRRFCATPLFREDYVVAHGPEHRFATMTEISVQDLKGEAYCKRSNCEYSDYIDKTLKEFDVTTETVQASPREDWIQSLVRANFGIAYMPMSLALEAGIHFKRTIDCPFTREITIFVPRKHSLSDNVLSLANTLSIFASSGGAKRQSCV